jgi:hypothetical protein
MNRLGNADTLLAKRFGVNTITLAIYRYELVGRLAETSALLAHSMKRALMRLGGAARFREKYSRVRDS